MDARLELAACLSIQLVCWLMPTFTDVKRPEHLAYLLVGAGLGIHAVSRGLHADWEEGEHRVRRAADKEVDLHHLATRAAWQQKRIESVYFPAVDQDGAPILDGGQLQDPTDMHLFDIGTLRDIDECPLISIIGKPGRGKSVLATWIAAEHLPGASIRVYDTDCKPEDWGSVPVYGRRGQFAEIGEQMVADLELLATRTDLRGSGKDYGGPEVRIIEEYPTLAADLEGLKECKGLAYEWLGRIARRGRKYRIRPILVSQNWNVKALKIEGDGELRDSFTVFHLGPAAYRAIKRESDKTRRAALYQFLGSAPRACVVEHDGQFWPWIVPDLNVDDLFTAEDAAPSIRAAKAPQVEEPVDVREYLERLRSLNAQGFPSAELAMEPTSQLEKSNSIILSQEQALIIAAAKEKGGALSVRDAMRTRGLNRYTSEQMLNLFRAIERQGLASVRTDPNYPNRYLLSLQHDS